MATALHLAIRTLHLLGMVALLGGTASAWHALRSTDGLPVEHLRRFECGFWAAMGVMVLTGVGNLGALGAPGPATPWGAILTGKLVVVLAFVVGSALRSLAVFRLDRGPVPGSDRRLEHAYAASATTLLVVVGLAEVLAHG